MTTEQAEKRVLRWYGSMPAGDFYADVQAYREAIRAETAAHLEEALREAREALTANITTWIVRAPQMRSVQPLTVRVLSTESASRSRREYRTC